MFTNDFLEKSWAVGIIKRMEIAFGDKFTKQWGANIAKYGMDDFVVTVQEALAGLNEVEISRGLATMRTKTFVPSLPEFRTWCVKGSSQFCDADTAYINAAHEKYSDAATYEAARRTGFYELRNRVESSTKPTFKKHYEAVCAELEVNPDAFLLPKSQRIAPAPPKIVLKDHAFIESLRRFTA